MPDILNTSSFRTEMVWGFPIRRLGLILFLALGFAAFTLQNVLAETDGRKRFERASKNWTDAKEKHLTIKKLFKQKKATGQQLRAAKIELKTAEAQKQLAQYGSSYSTL